MRQDMRGAAVDPALAHRALLAINQSLTISERNHDGADIIFVNAAFERATGYLHSEVVGSDHRLLFGRTTDARCLTRVDDAIARSRAASVTLQCYRKDGSTFWSDIRLSPLFSDPTRDGQTRDDRMRDDRTDDPAVATHFITIYTDVTTHVMARRDLEHAYGAERSDHLDDRLALRRMQEILDRSAALARTLQQALLPAALPDVEGLEFGAAYSPVGEGLDAGGDFYDVFEQRDGEWVLVIGDVMGKGIEAAAVTSVARHAIRTAALRARRPAALLTVLNEALLREGDGRPFCTVAASVLTRGDQVAHITLALGGHPKPFVVRNGGYVESVGRPGTLMGVVSAIEVYEVEIVLTRGDSLVLYTDGVTEAHNQGNFLGEEGLRRILSELAGRELGATDIAAGVQAQVGDFLGADLKDDLAVLVVRVCPSGFPRD